MRWLVLATLILTACSGGAEWESYEPMEADTMRISSPAFEHNKTIPIKYTQDAEDVNPPLAIEGVPEDAKSLVLIMDDPDAPDPKAPQLTWVHWVILNIPPDTTLIPEDGSIPGVIAQNQQGANEYQGPAPPTGEHRYFFKLYAINTTLELTPAATKEDVLEAMEGHVLEDAELIGLYSRE